MVVAAAFLFSISSVIALSKGHGLGHGQETTDKLPGYEKPNFPIIQTSSSTSSSPSIIIPSSTSSYYPGGGFLQRRDVPDALIDPYSVLGVLSFGVYIFYILYHRYQMGMGGLKHGGMGGGSGGGGGGNQQGSGNPAPSGSNLLFNSAGSEQNLAYLLDVASKILINAAKVGGSTLNGTSPLLDTLDYYDDPADLQSS